MVPCLLQIREEIKKLASGHISHDAASRLDKMALSAFFLKNFKLKPRQAHRLTGQHRIHQPRNRPTRFYTERFCLTEDSGINYQLSEFQKQLVGEKP
jgi:hypothetical protein